MDVKGLPKPPPDEVWVQKPDLPTVVVEMLMATAEEYNLVLWINGVKLWPKEDTSEQVQPAELGGEEDPKE